MWILTREHNEYNQYGEYFVACFSKFPTKSQVEEAMRAEDPKMIIKDAELDHILSGGGRYNYYTFWYNLRDVIPADAIDSTEGK